VGLNLSLLWSQKRPPHEIRESLPWTKSWKSQVDFWGGIDSQKLHTVPYFLSRGELSGKWSEISKVLFFKTGADHFKTAKQCR